MLCGDWIRCHYESSCAGVEFSFGSEIWQCDGQHRLCQDDVWCKGACRLVYIYIRRKSTRFLARLLQIYLPVDILNLQCIFGWVHCCLHRFCWIVYLKNSPQNIWCLDANLKIFVNLTWTNYCLLSLFNLSVVFFIVPFVRIHWSITCLSRYFVLSKFIGRWYFSAYLWHTFSYVFKTVWGLTKFDAQSFAVFFFFTDCFSCFF